MSWFLKKNEKEKLEILGDLLRLESFSSRNSIFWHRMGIIHSCEKLLITNLLKESLEISDMTAEELFKCSSWDEIQEKIKTWSEELKNISGFVFAKCTTAEPLPLKSRSKLTSHLSQVLQKPVEVEHLVKPDIVGGIIIQCKDKIFDASYKSILDEVEKRFTKYMLEGGRIE